MRCTELWSAQISETVIITVAKAYKSPPVNQFLRALLAHSRPWPLIQFRNKFSQTVGPLGRGISPSQGLYLTTDNTNIK
jgi:hypothetical protein